MRILRYKYKTSVKSWYVGFKDDSIIAPNINFRQHKCWFNCIHETPSTYRHKCSLLLCLFANNFQECIQFKKKKQILRDIL